MEKERRIKKEVSRLKKLYNGLDSDTMEIAKKLIERAAFMAVELEDLEVYLAENGWAGEFRQSDKVPAYNRARPEGQTYNTLNANYQKIMKQLNDLLPSKSDADAAKELLDFVAE